MKFFSHFNRPDCFPSSPGSPISSVFEERIDSNGTKRLVEVGKTSVDDLVQASFNDSLVYTVIKRATASGDSSALNRVKGFFADITAYPSNLAEAHAMLVDMQSKFDSLPIDIKRSFDNSADKFVVGLSNGTANKVIGDYILKNDKRFSSISNSNPTPNPTPKKEGALSE